MPINAQGYFNHLKTYLNMNDYGQTCLASEAKSLLPNQLALSEKIQGTNKRQKITLDYKGEAFAIKLDCGNDPLFHFLDNHKRPWSKRCDFVIFQCRNNSLFAYCIEFKAASTFIPTTDVMLQLKAGQAWCQSLSKIMNAYTNTSRQFRLTKFVVTGCANPDPDLDTTKKYLKDHPSIRHYLFTEIDGMNLEDLENSCVETIN